MAVRCKFGIHNWERKEATLRPGTIVMRCRDCSELRVKQPKSRPPAT